MLRLSARVVSGEHATLTWTGQGWELRDLGSRNGTWVDGVRLEPGKATSLRPGAEIAFGDPHDVWVLADSTAPSALAVCTATGTWREARGGLLVLPDDDEPEVTLYLDPLEGWTLETDDAQRSAADAEDVVAGGRTWRLMLPVEVEGTWELEAHALALETLGFDFAVSRDEEYVELTLVHGGGRIQLPPRAHLYLLLTLGRQRLHDVDLPPSERGWVHQEDLGRMLGMDRRALSVQICRARQQLVEAGVDGAAGVIERRGRTGQLRIGVGEVTVRSL